MFVFPARGGEVCVRGGWGGVSMLSFYGLGGGVDLAKRPDAQPTPCVAAVAGTAPTQNAKCAQWGDSDSFRHEAIVVGCCKV